MMSVAASNRSSWTPWLGLLVLQGLQLSASALDTAELPPLSHGLTALGEPAPAPTLRLDDLDGPSHNLADLRGRLVLVNFWATWCPPCRREMPSLERLYQQLQDRGLTVLAVDVGEDPDNVFAFTGQLDPAPGFPMLLDAESRTVGTGESRAYPRVS